MPITNRNLIPGTILELTYEGRERLCVALPGERGELLFRLDDGALYSSVSSAGRAATGHTGCNGWRVWSVRGGEAHLPVEARVRQRGARPPARAQQIRLVPNQARLRPGTRRWFCTPCLRGFVVEGLSAPDACPDGHPRELR